MADSALPKTDSQRPIAQTRTLRHLTRALDAVVAANDDPRVIAGRVGMFLGSALANPDLLEPRHCEPAENTYRQHLVHVHPLGRYSIVALVWKPGQATPIHDHRCWCVVGVWRGVERETTYSLFGDDVTSYLVPSGSAVCVPGDVSMLVPPAEDIHRVENAGDEIAISIHVYGADIAVHGSSINHTFGDELVRAQAPVDGVPRSWRQTQPS